MRAPLAALKGTDRDAHGDVHEKAAGIEGSSGNKSGGNRRVPDWPHRPVGRSVATLRGVPPAVAEGAQCAQGSEWRDLSMRRLPLKLRYRPRRVRCPRCGLRVEDFPWAEPWARVSTSLSNAAASLARELRWQATARHYGLNWKSVATIVKRTVAYGLRQRARP